MILCIPAPPPRVKNPVIRSIASEHKLSTPAIAAAINRRSIKERNLSVSRAIDEGLPASKQQLLLTDQSQRGGDTADPTGPSESGTLPGSQQGRDVDHTPVCGEHLPRRPCQRDDFCPRLARPWQKGLALKLAGYRAGSVHTR
jgi:hypothetical protein